MDFDDFSYADHSYDEDSIGYDSYNDEMYYLDYDEDQDNGD